VRQLPQLGDRLLGLLERFVQQAFGPRVVASVRALGELERDDGVDQPLLRAVVKIAYHAAAGLVAGAEDPRATRRDPPWPPHSRWPSRQAR
jgi:hypothetical protein